MNPGRLRFALLASLGVLPVACGGDTLGENEQGTTCSSPQTDPVTGLVKCSEGYTHRPTSMTCASDISAASAVDQASLPRLASPGSVLCEGDPDACAAFQYGYCLTTQYAGPICVSGCTTDQDCGFGFICLCNGADSWGRCAAATCHTNADCEEGVRCASSPTGYRCQTPGKTDACRDDHDCASDQVCQTQADGFRRCAPGAVPGRPFLVASEVRVAPIVRRSDWLLEPLAT